jgi:hypothetical protein
LPRVKILMWSMTMIPQVRTRVTTRVTTRVRTRVGVRIRVRVRTRVGVRIRVRVRVRVKVRVWLRTFPNDLALPDGTEHPNLILTLTNHYSNVNPNNLILHP